MDDLAPRRTQPLSCPSPVASEDCMSSLIIGVIFIVGGLSGQLALVGTIGAGFGEVLGRPSLPDIITYRSTTSHTGVHVSTSGGGKNQPPINIHFSTCDVDSGQTAHLCSNLTICDVEKCIDLHH